MKNDLNKFSRSLIKGLLASLILFSCAPPVNDPPVIESVPPQAISTVPVDGTIDVALNGTINITFTEAMNPGSISASTFTLYTGVTPVAGTVSYNSTKRSANFTTTGDMLASTVYTATVTTGVTDIAGNQLPTNKSWSFTTGTALDSGAPLAATVYPADLATGLSISTQVSATFSEGMDASTIVPENFSVKTGSTPILGTVFYDMPNKVAIFSPSIVLQGGTVYTATVSTGVKDAAGNALALDKVWTFTTASSGTGPAPVRLGTAANYVILSKTGISTVPASAVTGDIGVSPGAETLLTGFSQTKATGYSTSTQVTGFLYAADMTLPTPSAMTQAVSDMEAAYTDAATRPAPAADHTNIASGSIGGLTFTPGLYKWGSTVDIAADMTFSGGADDIWILQMSGDLVLENGMKVLLIGGAQAKNIYWQTAGYARLGTGSTFEGIILSQTQVILETGAVLNGRALAQTHVSLDQATVSEPPQ